MVTLKSGAIFLCCIRYDPMPPQKSVQRLTHTRNVAICCSRGYYPLYQKNLLRASTRSYKFYNNRRFPSKLPSANLQVTCAPASYSLAPQNSSYLHDNRSLINKHLTFTLRHDHKRAGLLRDVNIQA